MKHSQEESRFSLWGTVIALLLTGIIAAVLSLPNDRAWDLYDLDRYITARSIGTDSLVKLENDTSKAYDKVTEFLAKAYPAKGIRMETASDPFSRKLAPVFDNARKNFSFAQWYFIEHGLAAWIWWPIGAILLMVSLIYGWLDRNIRRWDHPVILPSKWPATLIKLSVFLLATALIAPLSLSPWLIPSALALFSLGLSQCLRQLN
jgi:hypothetical protein